MSFTSSSSLKKRPIKRTTYTKTNGGRQGRRGVVVFNASNGAGGGMFESFDGESVTLVKEAMDNAKNSTAVK